MELRRYPLFSLRTGSAIMRIWPANSTISSKWAGSVSDWPMTSAVLFFQMELAKCSDRYLSGRPVALANWLGRSVEEFVAMTVLAGSTGASLA